MLLTPNYPTLDRPTASGPPLDQARPFVFPATVARLIVLLVLLATGCAPPSVLREPVRGGSYAPVRAELPPLPAIMELTGDPPIRLPEPSSFTPIAAPRLGPDGRP